MATLAFMIVMFLGLSGVAAAIDAAVLSVTKPEIDELVQKSRWGAKRLREVKAKFASSVVVIVIVTNAINVLGPILVSHQAFRILDRTGVVMVTITLTLGTIVFSEILPKAMGAHHAPRLARICAPALMLGRRLLYPLVLPLSWLSERLTRGERTLGTEPQIRSLVRMGHKAGLIESDEESMIHRVFVLNDRTAADVMTSIGDVKALSAGCTIHQAAAESSRSEYSRYPIFGDSIDDVRGVALSRDLLRAVIREQGDCGVMSVAKAPLVVDTHARVDDLLVTFREQHMHMAIVQDTGTTVGIITLEDVLEQLVGQIDDEKDVA
ncbi:Magnesium and cobalt efflux protein CorC [Stieleria bergensis]|uniref:Magnesium and cobalt efflux protein CorC n=1 Tax=Stieleria bergensis TaxID=2528025 RepID=A0A517SZ50_9BACT|nr:Magnesium and cobalt efflux protein CorC [Planctomycetes bacterium SV_7m_r]